MTENRYLRPSAAKFHQISVCRLWKLSFSSLNWKGLGKRIELGKQAQALGRWRFESTFFPVWTCWRDAWVGRTRVTSSCWKPSFWHSVLKTASDLGASASVRCRQLDLSPALNKKKINLPLLTQSYKSSFCLPGSTATANKRGQEKSDLGEYVSVSRSYSPNNSFLCRRKSKQRSSPPTLFQENRALLALCTLSPVCLSLAAQTDRCNSHQPPRGDQLPHLGTKHPGHSTLLGELKRRNCPVTGRGAGQDVLAAFRVGIPNVRLVLIKTFGLQDRIFLSL